jgi:hypothetical protein
VRQAKEQQQEEAWESQEVLEEEQLMPGKSTILATLAAATTLVSTAAMTPPAAASFGIERAEIHAKEQGGGAATQAGSHPYALSLTIALHRKALTAAQKESGLGNPGAFGEEISEGDAKDVEATLPAGVAVNLLAVQRCSEQDLAKQACPASSQVGELVVDSPFALIYLAGKIPVFNIAPSSPKVAGALGFTVANVGFIAHLIGSVHAGGDYGISAVAPGLPQLADADGLTLTLWGDPSAASHCHQLLTGGPCVPVPAGEQPFLTLPTSCPKELTAAGAQESSLAVSADSWQAPGAWTPPLYSPPLPRATGCGRLSFTPSIEVRPETTVADTPTGVSVTLKNPQVEALGSLGEANLREAVITLPAGLSVSPSAVSGLGACSEAQVALSSQAAVTCPDASKIGSVEALTPLLDHPVYGSVYLAQQGNGGPTQGSNPFGSLIALYVVVEGSGVQIKVAGEVSLNQSTGQLTTRFKDLPQLPYSELSLKFFGGPRAALVAVRCGSYTTTSQLTPYSAPQSGPPATPQSTFDVATGPDGSPCSGAALPFAPTLQAGTTSNLAGAYSPFVTTFSRRDGEQELAQIQERIPPGLLAKIAGVALCEEPQAQAGTCGPESQIGVITVTAGPGTSPLRVTGGRIYLTGPYNDAPFGLSIVTPAAVGPFNLGNVIVRAALSVDPHTAAATVTTGPLPQILQGVPVQVRSVTVEVNRPEFIFNPSNCERKTISTTMQGSLGQIVNESVPFQAAGCGALAFQPKLTASTSGATSRTAGASLYVKLKYPQGPQGSQANIAKVKVALPKQLPARLTTLQKACPAKTFETNPATCPAPSAVAVVKATTPLLPVGLSGPAYFVSYGGAKFPELVVVLQGDGVSVTLHGETYISKAGITSSTFATIPDVPVGTFELYFPEGKYSALAANGNLCKAGSSLAIPTEFTAQNGAKLNQNTKIAVTGCPKLKKATKPKKKTKAKKGSAAGHKTKPRAKQASATGVAPPLVATGPASGVTQSEATLSGTVNPEGNRTSYAFELGGSTQYGTVISGTLAGTGSEAQSVTLDLANLRPGSTYHYIVVATNTNGTSEGLDETFTTPPATTPLSVPIAPALIPTPEIAFPSEPAALSRPPVKKKVEHPKPRAKKKTKRKTHRGGGSR